MDDPHKAERKMRGNPQLPPAHLRFAGGPHQNPVLQEPTDRAGSSPAIAAVPPTRWEERDSVVDEHHAYFNCLIRLGVEIGDKTRMKMFVWNDIQIPDARGNTIATINSPLLVFLWSKIKDKPMLARISDFRTRGYHPFTRPPKMIFSILDNRNSEIDRKEDILLGGCPFYETIHYDCVEINDDKSENEEVLMSIKSKFLLIDAANFSVTESEFFYCA
jgi:hypothetical protein